MATAREIMQVDAAFLDAADSVTELARAMRDQDMALVPICDRGALVGVVTPADIVHGCVADNRDPRTMRAGELARRTEATVDAEDSLETALVVMAAHRVRRLPVLEGDAMIGVLAQADVTRSLTL